MRLATWIGWQSNRVWTSSSFNLVLSKREKDIEAIFKRHIRENQRNRFSRVASNTYLRIYVKEQSSERQGDDDEVLREQDHWL